jgi:hypothetical protein
VSTPGQLPEGYTVDTVDWLPSGARSGLVRVRGHRPPAVSGPLPELILETEEATRRYVSLPDPRADRDPSAWRGAYVLEARPAAEADRLWLEWPGGRRVALTPLGVPERQVVRSQEPEPPGGQVVDRAILAERRARRAEASEQAQVRTAREALRAVEVLELRVSELEQRALEAEGERDALRAQAADAAEPDLRFEALSAEAHELRARLAEREAELARRLAAPAPAPEPAPIPAGEAEHRAERLRTALTATVATVAELRLRLHELQVARRTRDVSAAADAVRLAVVERERASLQEALETARSQLRGAFQARDEAVAALEGVRGAHEELRSRHAGLSGELGAARERIAELEGEVAAVTAEAERAAAEAMETARAEAAALAAEQAHDSNAQLDALRARLTNAEAAIAEAETAREVAEATALAAAAQRRAAEVAHAAHHPEPVSPTGRDVDPPATRGEAPPAPRVSEELLAAAAEAERAAAERQATGEAAAIVADLEAAAEALRASAAEPAAEPEPLPTLVEADRTFPTIVSAPTEPPADIARGRSTRAYPPLRGALVKLAHDDPTAAGRILVGLLRAQHAVLDSPPDYDLTITEVGTFSVSPGAGSTQVSPLDAPRGRGRAAFHLTTDALTLAEGVAGVAVRPRRWRGPVRATGRVREARRLAARLRGDVGLAALVHAGAALDPGLVLRAFAYAVRPAWTEGQQWTVELRVDDRPLTITARDTGGLTFDEGAPEGAPDARVRVTAEGFRRLVAGEPADPRVEGDERILERLLALAERARKGAD